MSEIADLLGRLSERTGLSDDALARVIGVRQATFTRWRNGTVGVGSRHAARIAQAAGVPVAEVEEMIAGQQSTVTTVVDDTLAALLTAWEEASGESASAVAPRFGVSLSIYLRWRKGLTVPAPPALAGIADVLGVPLETVVMAAYRSELARRH